MMNDAAITPEIIEQHNLTTEEYEKIKRIMGREPNLTELGVFSVMWSEHCSYKSSRVHLKRLPTRGSRVIVPPGENAGVVDIGDDWCVAFKVESHNHPSFIEPFPGSGDRRRRYLARCLHNGRPARRGDEQPAFWSARRSQTRQPQSLDIEGVRRGHRPLRQLLRRADDRRRGGI
jgi:hypothetical protein